MSDPDTSSRAQRVRTLFDQAVELDWKGRVALLDRECAGDRDLRREVEALVEAHESEDSEAEGVLQALRSDGGPAGTQSSDSLRDHLLGSLADQYRIEEQIGRGGMARVYRALDLKHRRQVAVKVMNPELAALIGPDRFLREIENTARLRHPHILPLFDSGEADGLPYYVMPLVSGGSLRDRLKGEGQLPIEDVLAITRSVAEALDAAAEDGLVHRDIKPENILLERGQALIADFGIARAIADFDAAGGTTTWVVVGTPEYMSPEQAANESTIDSKSDQYSLACVVYEMLGGRTPFSGRPSGAIIASQVCEAAPSIQELRPSVPEGMAAALEKALQKDPGDRYGSAQEFVQALRLAATPASPTEFISPTPTLSDGLRRVAIGAGLLAATLLVLVLNRPPSPPSRTTVSERPRSMVVLPYHTAVSTEPEKALALDLAHELTRELNGWEGTRAVPQVALNGVLFDLGLEGPTLSHVDDGIRVARSMGVNHLVALSTRMRGDSATVEANLFDAESRAQGQPLHAAGAAGDLGSLVRTIAYEVLGLSGSAAEIATLRTYSANPEALAEYRNGRRSLERWNLLSAERRFRGAVAFDTTFAMGYHRLAQTLYWQAARDPQQLSTLGPEIGRMSVAALRYVAGLPPEDSLHVLAFHRFQEGDYSNARRIYRTLIETDSTDVYALLLLGSVEYVDPWLDRGRDGQLTPRGNLNAAVRAFSETVRLSPDFHLGYGHLFDLNRLVLSSLDQGTAHGFELPRDEHLAPWDPRSPDSQRFFKLVALDSLQWLDLEDYQNIDLQKASDGAQRLLESSFRALRRWASYAPDDPRPQEVLLDRTLELRRRPGGSIVPEARDSLTTSALEYADGALTLKSDTVPYDLWRLANLNLAIGDWDMASAWAEQALALPTSGQGANGSIDPAAINVFIARGQTAMAIELLSRIPLDRRFVRDDETGAFIAYGGTEHLVEEINVLAATGAEDSRIETALGRLARAWSPDQYKMSELRPLSRSLLSRAPLALYRSPRALQIWAPIAQPRDPLWRAFVENLDDPPQASQLEAALASADLEILDPWRIYLLGLLAQAVEQHSLAIDLLRALDTWPYSVARMDVGWGLRSLAYYQLGRSYDQVGDTAMAARSYERFLSAWRVSDEQTNRLRVFANSRLSALR